MVGLNQAIQASQNWKAQGIGEGGGANRLYPKNGDVIFAWFMMTGQDDDPNFELYLAHEWPKQAGQQYPVQKLCPVQSGFDANYPCPGCRDNIKTKQMMAMWFYVETHLTRILREGEQLPVVTYNGQAYYQRDLRKPMLWDTSAWRDSCKDQIIFLGQQLQGDMHALQMILTATGDSLARRYNVVPNLGSPRFDVATYQKALPECTPIRKILVDSLNAVATVAAPTLGQVPVPAAPVFQQSFSAASAVAAAPTPLQTMPTPIAPSLVLPPVVGQVQPQQGQVAPAPTPVAPIGQFAPPPPPQPVQAVVPPPAPPAQAFTPVTAAEAALDTGPGPLPFEPGNIGPIMPPLPPQPMVQQQVLPPGVQPQGLPPTPPVRMY